MNENSKKTTDISEYYSGESFDAILDACHYVYTKGGKACRAVHLFYTLLDHENIIRLLGNMNIDVNNIKEAVLPFVKDLTVPFKVKDGVVIFSPDLREVILNAFIFARKINTQTVDAEDLFYACLFTKEINSVVSQLQLPVSEIEKAVVTIEGGQLTQANQRTSGSIVQKFAVDLVQKAKSGELEPIVNRETELAQVTRVLTRKAKNSVILLGENGVGRSSIVHLLAQKIAAGEVSAQLKDVTVLELNLSGVVTAVASRNVGEFTNILVDEIRARGSVILFIKDIGSIADEGSIEKALSANIIKTLLGEEGIRFVTTMNATSYRKLVAKEPTVLESFETVKVGEPSPELAIKILSKVAERLSKFHNISIGQDVVEACVMLSKRYIQDKFLPSKAVDLLDEASSKVALEGREKIIVGDIQTVISERTGIPVEKLTVAERKKLVDLEETLNKVIVGQQEAVHVVSEVIRRSRAGLKDPKKPIGTFLFLGPSGVGKTYLAKNLTRIVYDNEHAMIRLDMSEFSQSHTVHRLIGSPPGYVGYEEGGQLTNPVWEKPYSLILLDEIEKANEKVFDIFLQVLDEGRLTDGQGRTVDFKNTIIIATSNIASDQILEKLKDKDGNMEGVEREKFYEQEILPLLRQHFRPEFINRFDEIVVFEPLDVNELVQIAKLQMVQVQKRLKDKNINLEVSEEKLREFAKKSYNPAFGARPLIRLIQDQVENVIARKIISGEIKEGETVRM